MTLDMSHGNSVFSACSINVSIPKSIDIYNGIIRVRNGNFPSKTSIKQDIEILIEKYKIE